MKNYRMYFLNKKSIDLTAEQAASVYTGLEAGVQRILINGDVFVSHQITSIERICGQELADLCDKEGVKVKDAPKLDRFLSYNTKLLNG
jgi:hypothetical protein